MTVADLKIEKETLGRVQEGLFHLRRGLTPFVEARMKARFGSNWLHYASRAHGGSPGAALDEYGLLKTMIDNWREVFDEAFPRQEKHRIRNFTSMSLEARNATSHLSIPLQEEDALRYIDAMHALLRAVKAPQSEVSDLKRLYDEQRRIGIAGDVTEQPEPTTSESPKLALTPTQDGSRGPLRPWIEVALPHPDVLANRFREAEFAADLFAVDSGHATEDYATPEAFFRITFLTEGLKRIVTTSLQRLTGGDADPVIGLQTAFGGGKTHTMLAVYHLASATELSRLEGVQALAERAGVKTWQRPNVAVFVGTAQGADTTIIIKGGPRLHTLWGYLGWKLAGAAGLDLMAEAEAARTNPGSALLVELFKLSGPCAILLDELVAYARQLPDDRFEAFLSFVQSLTEAAKMSRGVLIVGSLPESQAEAGGPKGVEALLRLEKVFGRVQSAWLPASGDETYEIIRRRLFQPLDEEGEIAREEAVKAFHDLYRKNPAEFPPEAHETHYLDLLRLSYPIHPELFDRLSKDWASLPKFQRTRGVLRFMANVVGVLWHARAKDPLIMPARIPIAHERVRASVLYPLDPAFAAVVDREVDGEGALPARMELDPSRRISQARAATRAARAVFICSAPLVGQPNAGVTGQGLRLACAEPGDQLAIFGEALRELTERATFLYEEAGRYWFSTQPTLNRYADDLAKGFAEHEVDAAISEVLRTDAATKGVGFHKVFAAPDDPISMDEAQSLSLVILPPSMAHSGKGAGKSPGTDAATDGLTRCRASQRKYRNTLVFVAADEPQLATAREVIRKAMAWAAIVDDQRLQDQMTRAQSEDAKEKAKTSREGAIRAVRTAWSRVILPVKTDATPAGAPFELEALSISTKDRPAIPLAVYEKVGPKGDNLAKERLGPDTLWLHIEPLWPRDRPHLLISELAEWFASYVYLPKLRDRVVLEGAIRDGVGKLDPAFGYADGVDEAAGTYKELTWGRAPPDVFPSTAVLIRPEAALAALDAQGKPAPEGLAEGGLGGQAGGGLGPRPAPEGGPDAGGDSKPRRFYGSVEIDMMRPVKAFETILNEVVLQLDRSPGAKVKITLEIEAENPSGFSDDDVGVVRDNARQLKFKSDSTGFGG